MAADVRSHISRQHYALRPPSEQLVDLHVYLAPQERWVERRKLAKNHIVDYSISSGFVRVIPQQTLFELRNEIDSQLGYEVLPRNYIFLRSVGRNFTQVKPKQEMEMKVKNFMPPYASEPEIYIKEGVYDSRWSQAEDSGLDDSLTDSNFSSSISNRDRGTPDSNDELTSSPGPAQSPTTSGQGSSSTSSEDMAADVVTASSSHAVSVAQAIKPEQNTSVSSTRTSVNGPLTTRSRVAAQRNRDRSIGDSGAKNKSQGLPSQSKGQIRKYPLTEARQRRRAAAGSNSGDSDTPSGGNKGQISDISTTSRRRPSNRSSLEGGMTNKNASSNHLSKTNGRRSEHKSRVVAKKQALSELNNGKLKEEDENEENKKDGGKEKGEEVSGETEITTSEGQIDDGESESEKRSEGEEGNFSVESTTIKLLDADGKEIETLPVESVTLDPNEAGKKEHDIEGGNEEEITRIHELSISDKIRDEQDADNGEKCASEKLVQEEPPGRGEGDQEEMKKEGRGNESDNVSSRLNETEEGKGDDVENEKSTTDEEGKSGENRVNGDSGSPLPANLESEGTDAQKETTPRLSIDVSVVEIDEKNKDEGSHLKSEGDENPPDPSDVTDTNSETVEESREEKIEGNETEKAEENNGSPNESGIDDGIIVDGAPIAELKKGELDSTPGDGSENGNEKTSPGDGKGENGEDESKSESPQLESKMDNLEENDGARTVTNDIEAQDEPSSAENEATIVGESSAENETKAEVESLAKNDATSETGNSTENEASSKAENKAESEATAEGEPSVEDEATSKAEPTADNEATSKAEPTADNEATAEAESSADNEATAEAESSEANEATAEAESSAGSEATAEAEPSAENETTAEAESSADNEATAEAESSADNEVTAEAESSADNEATVEAESSADNEATAEAESSADNEATAEAESSAGNEATAEAESSAGNEATAEAESSAENKADNEAGDKAEPSTENEATNESSAHDEAMIEEESQKTDDATSHKEQNNENEANLESESIKKEDLTLQSDTCNKVGSGTKIETTVDNENEVRTEEGSSKEVEGNDVTSLDAPTKDEGEVPEDENAKDEETAEINVNSEDGASTKDENSVDELQSKKDSSNGIKKVSKSTRKTKESGGALKSKGSKGANVASSTSRRLTNKGGKLPLPATSKRKSSSDRLQIQSDASGEGMGGGSLRRSHSDSNGISRLGLRADGKGLGAYGNQFYSSYNLMKDVEDMDLEKMKKYLSDARNDRKELEVQREALVRRIRQLHSKANKIKEQAREAWRRRYLEAKKQTPKLEEECSRLRLELEKYLRELIAKVQGGNMDFPSFGVTKGEMPSNRFSYKIMILRMLQEIEDLRRRAEGTKIRHAAEYRLREQAENDVKALREESVKKKIQVTLTRNQADSVLRDSYYTNSF